MKVVEAAEVCKTYPSFQLKKVSFSLEKGKITRTELFTLRFIDTFKRCGGNLDALDPLRVNDDFIQTMSVNGVLMDGALEFVQRLNGGIPDSRLYIITNGATINARGRIASTGLDRYIDGLFVSEDMQAAKPAREYFDIVLNRIGEPKEACVMIGDSLSSDMLGAKNAGLCSVWFRPSGDIESAMREYEIDFCAASFDELYAILVKWSTASV